MLAPIIARRLPTALCTVYAPRFPPLRRRLAIHGLAPFNDVIVRETTTPGLSLIDLRLVCNEGADSTSPIEPSVVGGAKIAAAIAGLAGSPGDRSPRSTVYGRDARW